MPAAPKAGKPAAAFDLGQALLTSFDTNNRICTYMIEGIDASIWAADPPGGKGRTIAAVVAHMHNVRVMWLKAAAKDSKIPEQLDRHTVTPAQAIKGLNTSAAALREVIAWVGLSREADPAAGSGHHEPQHDRHQANQPRH